MPRFHGNDLRKGRCSLPGQAYLLTFVTLDRAPRFVDWRIGRLVVREMRASADAGSVESLAWVIMPDHVHWLLMLRLGTLADLMRRVKSASAIRVNRHCETTGPVWQPGYHDHALRRDENLLAAARYVVANPLRARLVKNLNDYPLWDAAWL